MTRLSLSAEAMLATVRDANGIRLSDVIAISLKTGFKLNALLCSITWQVAEMATDLARCC